MRLGVLFSTALAATATMQAGDCAVVGVNMDSYAASTQFAILLLSTVPAGVTISATDDGWDTRTNKFYSETASTDAGSDYNDRPYDLHVSYVASAEQPAGTVLTSAHFSSTLNFQQEYGPEGDHLIVYAGPKASPTFLCALDLSVGYSDYYCNDGAANIGWADASCDGYYAESSYMYWSGLPSGLSSKFTSPI